MEGHCYGGELHRFEIDPNFFKAIDDQNEFDALWHPLLVADQILQC